MRNKHHNLPKSSGGGDTENNITFISEKVHTLYHIFAKVLPPHLVIKLVIRISSKCLCNDITKAIIDILESKTEYDLYKSGIIKDKQKFYKACRTGDWVNKIKT